jgi:cytoskeletal protein CcmA (bactofilin family)
MIPHNRLRDRDRFRWNGVCPERARGGVMANGQSIVIKGEITGNEDLVIAGRVEGSIRLENRVLTLAAGSQVIGDVAAGSVLVSGKVDGSIAASTRLEIRNTAVVEGELTAPVLVIAEGAHVCAEIEMPAREKRPTPLAVAV